MNYHIDILLEGLPQGYILCHLILCYHRRSGKYFMHLVVFCLIESTMNLQEFIDMTGEGEGEVMDYKTFIRSFTSVN